MYATVHVYTGQVIFFKLPKIYGYVYKLVTLYKI